MNKKDNDIKNESAQDDKPSFYILPNAASGAGSAMAAPFSKKVTPKPRIPAKIAPEIPAVGLEAAKKASRQKNMGQKNMDQTAEQKEQTSEQPGKNEAIDMATTKENFEKLAAETAAYNQEQLDALIKSGNLLLAGTQDILKTCADLTQKSVEQNSEALRSLLGCKTLAELTDAQTRLAQQSFEGLVNNATTLSELSVKVATESFEPLNTQLNKAVQKATEAAAA